MKDSSKRKQIVTVWFLTLIIVVLIVTKTYLLIRLINLKNQINTEGTRQTTVSTSIKR